MKVLITGAKGFVGRNLVATLKNIRDGKDKTKDISIDTIYEYDIDNTFEQLETFVKKSNYIINLAGINRPKNAYEFYEGNATFSLQLCRLLKKHNNFSPIINASSIQAERDNDYGRSKKQGEDYLLKFGKENGNPIYIYRFANLFGKWCRPNYNSVVATWCYNIANGIDIHVNDGNVVIPLCYVDDVVEEILHCIMNKANKKEFFYQVEPVYNVSLGELERLITSFNESRTSLYIVEQTEFAKKLYATYLSYLPKLQFSYPLKMNVDQRGSFTEFLKTKEYGQVSVNVSKPGITKGQHWHHTKNEKFLVVSGIGIIQFRRIGDKEIIEYNVSGEKLEVIDIPTGYTHNIINIGKRDMVTVMWSNEIFNPNNPDTFFEEV